MKKIMVLCLLVLQGFLFYAVADGCAPFRSIAFCAETEMEDYGRVNAMIILKGDCTFDDLINDQVMGSGTWEKEDPARLTVIRLHYEDDEGKEVMEVRAKLTYVPRDKSASKLVINGTELEYCE